MASSQNKAHVLRIQDTDTFVCVCVCVCSGNDMLVNSVSELILNTL